MSKAHDEYTRRILDAVEAGRPVSQRSLSRELGVALGLTNSLIRRLVKRGFLRVLSVRANRMSYLITPAGIAEKARVTRAFLQTTVRLYTETREQIHDILAMVSREWDDEGAKRVVFYGAGDVAEIGYISLQNTDLTLVGVVDDRSSRSFMGYPVHDLGELQVGRPPTLAGRPFSRIIIMSITDADEIAQKLRALGFPPEQICLLRTAHAPGATIVE